MPGDPVPTAHAPVFGSVWKVELLGGLQLRHGDLTIDRLSTRHALRLFARLALAPRTAWPRDELAKALWPELCEGAAVSDVARRRLRNTLGALRALLEQAGTGLGTAFAADRDTVQINAAAFDVDVHRFERHLLRREWVQALATYRGELLPRLADEFVDTERERLAARRAWAETAMAAPPADDEAEAAAAETPRAPVVPYLTRFFGREAQIGTLCRAVESTRIVTLVGVGGCGKTRLAVEAARELAGFDGVVFVPLAECQQAAQIAEHLRAALGVQPSGRPPIEQVAVRLADRRTLLLLDNLEQLVGPDCDAAIDLLLDRLPRVHLLVTSRQPLARADETVVALDPLPLPPPGADADQIARSPAVALFGDRARAARSDFRVSGLNAGAVAAVCELLGGLPLAIELAAAQIRRHTPPAMLVALQASLRGLARPAQRAARAGRHASLDAALDWSWRLLDPAARALLQTLTAFRGGWTREQAAAVAAGGDIAPVLQALVDSSLVQAAPLDGAPRLQMLHVVREFVAARTAAPQAAAARARHRAHFVAAAMALDGRHAWPLAADLANFVQAAASAIDDDEPGAAAALMLALAAHWRARGASDEALALLQRLTDAPGLPLAQHVGLRLLLVGCALNAGRGKDAHAQVVLALEAAGDERLLRANAVLGQATVHWRAAHDGARTLELLRQAQALLEAGAPAELRGRWLLLRGAVALEHEDDAEAAARCFEDAERLFHAAGDVRTSLLALPGRAACLLKTNRLRETVAMASAGERSAAELGDIVTRLQMLNRLLLAQEELGELDAALAVSQRTVRLAHQHGSRYFLAFEIWNQPMLLAKLQRFEPAALLMPYASEYWRRHMRPVSADDETHMARVRALCEQALGTARCRALWERGSGLADAEALRLAAGDTPALERRRF
jgi:predicted ATPase